MRHRITFDDNINSLWTLGDPERTGVAMKYIVQAYQGEPLLCLRGRDMLTLPTANYYLALVMTNCRSVRGPVEDAVRQDIAAIQAWQEQNPTLLKYPDRPEVPAPTA